MDRVSEIHRQFHVQARSDFNDVLGRLSAADVIAITLPTGAKAPLGHALLEDIADEFVRIMHSIPDKDVPLDIFREILLAKGENAETSKDVKAAYAKRKEKQARDLDGAPPRIKGALPVSLASLMNEKEVPSYMIDSVADLWGEILKVMNHLPLSPAVLAASMTARSDMEELSKHLPGKTKISTGFSAASKPAAAGEDSLAKTKEAVSKKLEGIDGIKIHWPDEIDDVDGQWDRLVGLDDFKQTIQDIIDDKAADDMRVALMGGKSEFRLPNFVAEGDPGTGKTSAFILAGAKLHRGGVLKVGHVIETDKTGLVGKYVGHSGSQTHRVCDAADQGLLFVDEGYALQGDSFSDDAQATVLVRCERGTHITAFAGYPRKMREWEQNNPGIFSRFFHQHFPTPDRDLLGKILDGMMAKKRLTLPEGARDKILDLTARLKERDGEEFGNGRAIRNIVEDLSRRHSRYLSRSGILAEIRQHKDAGTTTEQDVRNLNTVTVDTVTALCRDTLKDVPAPKFEIGFAKPTPPLRSPSPAPV